MSGVETHEGQRAFSCFFVWFFFILEGVAFVGAGIPIGTLVTSVLICNSSGAYSAFFFNAWSCATVALQRKLIHWKIMLFTDDMYMHTYIHINVQDLNSIFFLLACFVGKTVQNSVFSFGK